MIPPLNEKINRTALDPQKIEMMRSKYDQDFFCTRIAFGFIHCCTYFIFLLGTLLYTVVGVNIKKRKKDVIC